MQRVPGGGEAGVSAPGLRDPAMVGSAKGFVLSALGLAFAFQCLRFKNITYYFPAETYPYVAALLAVLVAVLAATGAPAAARRLLLCRGAVACAAAAAALALAVDYAALAAGLWASVSLPSALLGCVASASGILVLLAWYPRVEGFAASEGMSLATALLLAAFFLSMLLPILMFSYSPIPWLFPIVSPFVAGVSCCLYDAGSPIPEDGLAAGGGSGEVGGPGAAPGRVPAAGESPGLPTRMMLAMLIVLSLIGNLDGGLVELLEFPDYLLWTRYIVTIIACCCLFFSLLMARNRRLALFSAWFAIASVITVAMVCLWLSSPAVQAVGATLLPVCNVCSDGLIFFMLLSELRDPVQGLRYFAAAYALPKVLGRLLSTALLVWEAGAGGAEVSRQIALLLGIASSFLLVIALGAFVINAYRTESAALFGTAADAGEGLRPAGLPGREPGGLRSAGGCEGAVGPSEAHAALTEGALPENVLARLSARYSLTPRETVIMEHAFRGYSLQRIAELECVTLNTVKSHWRNLYRKLGVHSRQDLIDLVEAELRGR